MKQNEIFNENSKRPKDQKNCGSHLNVNELFTMTATKVRTLVQDNLALSSGVWDH